MTDPIRVFVGAGRAQRLPFLVLRRSILQRTYRQCDVRSLDDCGITYRLPKDKVNRPRTPFSFQRFAIPALCGYQGRAIYLDSDMLVLDDIENLWSLRMDGAAVLATDVDHSARNAVLLIDCVRAMWDLNIVVDDLDAGRVSYRGLMEDLEGLGPVARTIHARWNRLDEHPPDTALLHYTDMRRQPWRAPGHPLEWIWLEELEAAVRERGTDADIPFVKAEEAARHVRVGLAGAIEDRTP